MDKTEYETEVARIFADLKKPFHSHEIEWRVAREVRGGQAVQVLAYLTARAVMDRLDAVLGPDRWDTMLVYVPEQGFICEMTITLPGDTLATSTRSDVCDFSDIEGFKGAASGALKRAAVQLGVGRYLYALGDTYADLHDKRPRARNVQYHKGKFWVPPELPPKFLPTGYGQAPDDSNEFDEIPIPSGKPADDSMAAVLASAVQQAELVSQIALEFQRRKLSFRGEGKQAAAHALQTHFGVGEWAKLKTMSVDALKAGIDSFRKGEAS